MDVVDLSSVADVVAVVDEEDVVVDEGDVVVDEEDAAVDEKHAAMEFEADAVADDASGDGMIAIDGNAFAVVEALLGC